MRVTKDHKIITTYLEHDWIDYSIIILVTLEFKDTKLI